MAKQIDDTLTRDMIPGDIEGIEWWNRLSESDRLYWMNMAKSSCPADAWDQYRAARQNVPKPKRGRPATGKAMSAVERKRAQRKRERAQIWGEYDLMGNLSALTLSALLEGMASAVREGSVAIAEMIGAELTRRAEENKKP